MNNGNDAMTPKPNPKDQHWLSKCHKADVLLRSADEGTSHYECSVCHKPCDFYDPDQPETPELDETIANLGPIHKSTYNTYIEARPEAIKQLILDREDRLRYLFAKNHKQNVRHAVNQQLQVAKLELLEGLRDSETYWGEGGEALIRKSTIDQLIKGVKGE